MNRSCYTDAMLKGIKGEERFKLAVISKNVFYNQ